MKNTLSIEHNPKEHSFINMFDIFYIIVSRLPQPNHTNIFEFAVHGQ